MRDRDSLGLFIDPTSINRNGDIVHFTGRIDSRVPASPESRYLIIGAAIDCGRHSIAVLVVDEYGEGGRRIATRRILPSEVTYEAIGQDQGFNFFQTRVCSPPTAFQSIPAPDAVQWELVAREADNRLLIDPASITHNGDVVEFTGRLEASPAPRPDRRMIIFRLAFDCRRHTTRLLAGDTYGENGTQTGSRRMFSGEGAEETIGRQDAAIFGARVCPPGAH